MKDILGSYLGMKTAPIIEAKDIPLEKMPFKLPPDTEVLRQWEDGLGYHLRLRFQNTRGASVIRGPYSYGEPHSFELAVLDHDGCIDYATPLTDDVIGDLAVDDVERLLMEIAAMVKP